MRLSDICNLPQHQFLTSQVHTSPHCENTGYHIANNMGDMEEMEEAKPSSIDFVTLGMFIIGTKPITTQPPSHTPDPI